MQVAASYAADQLALLLNGGGAPAWFAAETAATIVDGDDVTAFQGNAAGYVAAASAAIGTGNVAVSNIAAATGVAGTVLVTVTGTITAEGCTRGFSLTSNLGESDAASTMYTVSETFALSEAVAAAPAAVEAAAEEAAPVAAAAPVEEAAVADQEVAAATAEANEAAEAREETPTPPSPPASPAAPPAKEAPKAAAKAEAKAAAPAKPAPKGWAAVAAANSDQKMKPAPVKPVTPQPEPEAAPAPAAKPVAAPKRKSLQQATFKVLAEVSDDEIRAALPESLLGEIVLLRNKSSEPTTQRVWIDFAIADAVSKLNAAKITLAGKPITAEEARKKPVQPK